MEIINSSLLQALIITKNEAPNIERVLEKLKWIEKVVILDSYSTDSTLEILQTFPNVELHYRPFDSFARQCNYGMKFVNSRWVLSLDADYVLTDGFIEEAKRFILNDDEQINGYYSRFEYLIYGRILRSNNTTPRVVLFRKDKGHYIDDGHAHRLELEGSTEKFRHPILHDDRKSLSRWLSNQDSYSIKESAKIIDSQSPIANTLLTRIRRTKILAPIFVFFYCLIVKRLFMNGWAGWYYILQRTMVEMLWALRMIEYENFKISQSYPQHNSQRSSSNQKIAQCDGTENISSTISSNK